jgi:hypothetical protein
MAAFIPIGSLLSNRQARSPNSDPCRGFESAWARNTRRTKKRCQRNPGQLHPTANTNRIHHSLVFSGLNQNLIEQENQKPGTKLGRIPISIIANTVFESHQLSLTVCKTGKEDFQVSKIGPLFNLILQDGDSRQGLQHKILTYTICQLKSS